MYISGVEKRAALRLVLKHWAGKPLPIDPTAIAEAEGLIVRPYGPLEISEGTSGFYNPHDRDGALIGYNPTESELRRRFTIAHELGHHVLRHGARPRDTAKEFTLSTYDPIEAAANRFAAALLMPDPAVRNMVERRGISSVEELAKRFRVSEVAMKFKLQHLNLI